MRITKEALSIKVVVRRVEVGAAAPFRWEVYGEEMAEPIHISPDRFSNMEAAYNAGQARLAEFVPAQRSMPPGITENGRWQSRTLGLSNHDTVESPDSYATL